MFRCVLYKMELRQVCRLVTFGYVTALPSILIFWILPLLPEVISVNLGVTDPSQISRIASYFEAAFFIGLIVGSLLWPYALHITSKRNAILIGLVLQGVSNALNGQTTSIPTFIFLRFLTACFSNVNTIGKDFIFDFAKPKYQQYAYNVKNLFSLASSFGGPILGWYIYEKYDHNLADSLIFISMFYGVGIALFVVVFYLDFTQGDNQEIETEDSKPKEEPVEEEHKMLIQDEGLPECSEEEEQDSNADVSEQEEQPQANKLTDDKVVTDVKRTNTQTEIKDVPDSKLIRGMQPLHDSLVVSEDAYLLEGEERPPERMSLMDVFVHCLFDNNMRNLIVVYFITNGVYKAQVLVTIFFLETSWKDHGYGLSAQVVATINICCYIPVAISVAVSPLFVPSKVSYSHYTTFLIVLLAVALFSVPLSRELVGGQSRYVSISIAYGIQAIVNISTPKMYSPFLNFIMNKSMHSDYRTSLNSITFILSNLSAACLVLLIVPFYSQSMFDPAYTQYAPYNKYFCFVFLDMFLMIVLPFIWSMNEEFKTLDTAQSLAQQQAQTIKRRRELID